MNTVPEDDALENQAEGILVFGADSEKLLYQNRLAEDLLSVYNKFAPQETSENSYVPISIRHQTSNLDSRHLSARSEIVHNLSITVPVRSQGAPY